MFIDQHLSETVEHLRSVQLGPINHAIVEAAAITEDRGIVPSTSVGNSASFAVLANKIIVEINLSQPAELEGLHDIYFPGRRPSRVPIPVVTCESRVGFPYVPIDPDKIVAIVVTDEKDSASSIKPPDADTDAIAGHLIRFLEEEVAKGRLDLTLHPLQAGIGTIANSVLSGLASGPFHLRMYSEVLQDSTFDLFDAGKLTFASGSSITLSTACAERVFGNFEKYKEHIVLRPQEISNYPEVIRRLGVMGINTALEFDIYGNVNLDPF
ncbi:acyl-CoA hydrolase [Pseudorhizobium tarimense]|uniref:Acyl-CoA hydrolase n=1 Tax=Pseudorhizobium tarimense TaxID=1079109 RepID=A0ABV2H4E6_9HYPH